MDGSLGILYWTLAGLPAIATRGSFQSEQAVWATEWLRQRESDMETSGWPEGYTPIFEIIYPGNQIVVRYKFSGLVLLALVRVETGEELPHEELKAWAHHNGTGYVLKYDKLLISCAEEDEANEEGYVAAWHRPGTTPLRVKIKFATYCRLHKLLTQTNAITVWEMLRDGLSVAELTKDVPDEFKGWITGLEKRFATEFAVLEQTAWITYHDYKGEKNAADPAAKKAFAEYAVSQDPDITPLLFCMLTGKRYAPLIWRQIRPRGDEKTFKNDIDL